MELHGDRKYGDDPAVIGGIAAFHGMPVTVIVQEKGCDTKENIHRNFGMPMPEGYRKALRLMKQAEKFRRPVICFVDTPGAFCGIEAEERGQGAAIADKMCIRDRYCAIAAAGSMSGMDAVRTVRARGIFMEHAAPEGTGAMAAVLGMDGEAVERTVHDLEGVFIANYNCPGQIVITGEKEAVEPVSYTHLPSFRSSM